MQNRRGFLKGAFVIGAIATGAKPVNAAENAPPSTPAESPMRVSVLSYSFHGLLRDGLIDIFGFMETCKYRYHLGAADLWNGFLKSTDEKYLRQVRDGLDERELVVPNLACDECTLWVDDEAQREKYHQNALAHLNAAKFLGARFARFDAGGEPSRNEWTNQEFDFIVTRYREYCQIAHDNGFKTGAEVHWGPEAWWPSMEKLCNAVDHPAFAICCHIGGWKGSQEEKDHADRECVPWVAHTHIPWNICEGPLAEKMTSLRDGGYQGYYSVEHHSAKDEYANVAIQLAKVRAVLQTWREN